MSEELKVLYSIGHSNQSLETFLELLKKHQVEVVVDVRSKPYARYATHFSAPLIQKSITDAGFKYLFLGRELGGKPDRQDFYDAEGKVDYARIAESCLFRSGMTRLKKGLSIYRIALMCGEENPEGCHRRHLIARAAQEDGIIVQHIRGDGRLETEEDLIRQGKERQGDNGQLSLFEQTDSCQARPGSPAQEPLTF